MKAVRGGIRAAVLMGAAASVLAFAGGAKAQNFNFSDSWLFGNPPPNDNPWPYATTGKSPVLAVVGDIACQPGATEVSGESPNEICTDPAAKKGNYNSTSLWQSQEATASQIEAMKPDAVALLGDLQYQVGLYTDFKGSFDLTYGAFKFLHRPAPGNHEFYDEHGETGVAGYGYFSYYNGFQVNSTGVDGTLGSPITAVVSDPCPSGLLWTEANTPAPLPSPYPASPCSYSGTNSTPVAQPVPLTDGQAGHFDLGKNGGLDGKGVGEGWYSYNLGSWHIISLNIECSTQQPDGCPALGAEPSTGTWLANELAWLGKDLQENHAPCTAAYWHQATFSATNSITPEGIAAQLFWQKLYKYRADLVLNGHDHLYAHYRPLDPSGNYDPRNGIREFIVGTGGETLDPIYATTETSSTGYQPGYPKLAGETNQEDPTGNTNFNATNLEAYTGDYWGVMKLTLDPNGYQWDFESAPGLASPTTTFNGPTFPAPTATGYSDKGFGTCHGGHQFGW
jgi:acid phosphatase type 7